MTIHQAETKVLTKEEESEKIRKALVDLISVLPESKCREIAEGLHFGNEFSEGERTEAELRSLLTNTMGVMTDSQCEAMLNRVYFKQN